MTIPQVSQEHTHGADATAGGVRRVCHIGILDRADPHAPGRSSQQFAERMKASLLPGHAHDLQGSARLPRPPRPPRPPGHPPVEPEGKTVAPAPEALAGPPRDEQRYDPRATRQLFRRQADASRAALATRPALARATPHQRARTARFARRSSAAPGHRAPSADSTRRRAQIGLPLTRPRRDKYRRAHKTPLVQILIGPRSS